MGQTLQVITGGAGGVAEEENVQKEPVPVNPVQQRMRITGWGRMQHLDVVWSKNDKDMDEMRQVTFMPDEGVCVTIPETSTIRRFDSEGKQVVEYLGSKVRPLEPTGLAVSIDGKLLALCDNEYTKGMRQYATVKPYNMVRSNDKLFMDSVAIAVCSSNGYWIVVEAGEQNCINILRPNGTRVRYFGQKHLKGPRGVAVDPMDRIYVTDEREHAIFVFTMTGDLLFQFGRHGHGDAELDMPQGICIDPDNNVYVADYGNDRISMFRSDGTLKFHLKSEKGIKRPRGLALDNFSGRLAVITKDLDWPSTLYVFSLREES